jgi:hypothetical protein
MSQEAADRQQQEIRNFLNLLPLTLDIAGLPKAEPGHHFTEGQLEVRVNSIRNAYKLAKKLLRDVAAGQ